MAVSPGLFDRDLPPGFHYRENFITDAFERVLLEAIADVAFSDFEMRGVVARRRVAFFGQTCLIRTPLAIASGAARNTVAKYASCCRLL